MANVDPLSSWRGLVGPQDLESLPRIARLAKETDEYTDALIHAASTIGLGGEAGGLVTKLINIRDQVRLIGRLARGEDLR